ncbi:MAG TPA: TolC family protein [Deltaproteobacteria bacterium]|nr:TolC family protein [Deltaproteobacteria bacterium]
MDSPRLRYYFFFLLPIITLVALPFSSRSETLEEAWKTAAAVDHGLRSVYKTTKAAMQNLKSAKAGRLPGFSLESGYRLFDNETALIAAGSELPTGEDKSFSYKATSSINLFTSGRISHGIDAAEFSLEAARIDEKRALQDLKMEVAETYVTVLRMEHGVAVAKSHVESLKSHARDVENMHSQGFVASNDLLAARVALADARQQALQAENRLDIARSDYNRLLGRTLTSEVKLSELELEPPAEGLAALTEQALKQRSELKSLSRNIEALRHQAAMIRAAYGPQVTLSGGYSYIENSYQVNEKVWSAMIGVRWNLFDGGTAYHKSIAVERRADSLFERYNDLKLAIALQMRQAWLNVIESRRRVEVTRKALAQAEENLKVAKDRYQEGLDTNTVVLDAETLRTKSYGNHDNAVHDAMLAILRLRRVMNGL